MEIQFPYEDVDNLTIPDENLLGLFKLPGITPSMPLEKIMKLINDKLISAPVGLHMIPISRAAMEKAQFILVSDGISEETKLKLGLQHASAPQEALEKAFDVTGQKAKVAVLKNAAEMIPVLN